MSTKKLERTGARALRPVAALAAAVLGIAGALPAQAQASPPGWQFELTNYIWGTALSGVTQTGAVPATSVDVSFSDIFDVLDFAWSGLLEARNGKWGVLTDIQYYKLSMGGTGSHTGSGGTLTTTVDITVKQTLLGVAGAYRVSDGLAPIDLIGGVRYTKLDVEAEADFSTIGLTGSNSRRGSKSWYDPFIGARVSYPFSDRWSATGYADIGGFGAGSKATWQVSAGLQYRISDKFSVKFGYRVLDVDYDEDGFKYDMKSDGVYLGLGVRF